MIDSQTPARLACPILGLAIAAALAVPQSATAEFDETQVLIEINATDGDAGFHAKFDAGAWKEVRMNDPDGMKLLDEKAFANLRLQGLTENFFESAEPVCDPEDSEDDEPVVSLAEFISRFPAGDYTLFGKTNEGEHFAGDAELTYDLPAAPDIDDTDGAAFVDGDPVVIAWGPGEDLGEKCHDPDLIEAEIIADPAEVVVVGWEVVVEPADGDGIEPERVFSVQLPPGQTEVTVPAEFIETYIDVNDVEEFKFEVGAIEASGNQTFSEGEFCIVDEAGEECEEDED
ncbi:hypothetical protein [Elongatibacter sediminis]|uniref:DUF4382 domain-containing protein n=1 Tax=Elongatibacter sediminis TaxID=3119006 RepID=A0AAW9R7P8_9GAMM